MGRARPSRQNHRRRRSQMGAGADMTRPIQPPPTIDYATPSSRPIPSRFRTLAALIFGVILLTLAGLAFGSMIWFRQGSFTSDIPEMGLIIVASEMLLLSLLFLFS